MEPPARNALWRYGYRNPVNYNDNELYCGGYVVHYVTNKGKCGQINITADLTTNHQGWMEVKICPNNDPYHTVEQDCLDRHPLKIVGKDTHKFVIPKGSKKVET
ncbi:hypothetical protein Avbf_08097, partial [Armadillidium vulgare]